MGSHIFILHWDPKIMQQVLPVISALPGEFFEMQFLRLHLDMLKLWGGAQQPVF